MHSRKLLACGLVMLGVLVAFGFPARAAGPLTATQSIELERGPDGWGAYGTLVIDLALGPRWHLDYLHERGWVAGDRYIQHDMSATRYLTDTVSATIGWRVKAPESGTQERFTYALAAWEWGA